jgi:hypothetical protein
VLPTARANQVKVSVPLSTLGDKNKPRRDRWRRRAAHPKPARGGTLGFGPAPLRVDRRRVPREREEHRLRWAPRMELGAIFAGVLGLGTLVFVVVLALRGTRVDVDQTGLEDDAVLNAVGLAALDVRITLPGKDDMGGVDLSFDGKEIDEPEMEGNVIHWRPPEGLAEGEHSLKLSVPRPLFRDAEFTWDFVVDMTAPAITAPPVVDAVGIEESATVSGAVEPGTSLVAGGREVEVDDDGNFTVTFARPPAGPVLFEAVDAAGNRTIASVVIPVRLPSIRAVHVSASAWSDPRLRDQVLQMVDEHRIDTVQLDLKDEQGVVGFDTTVQRAREIGAVAELYDLDKAVETIESHGARVMGRIATFNDPILAGAAWNAGQADQVIQNPDGEAYGNARFTNFAHPEVQKYNLDIALDAVSRGVDHIVWDEVRLPGDPSEDPIVPLLQGQASDALVGFLANAHGELRRRGVYQGVFVLGLSVNAGDLYAQDISQMARRADYVVPIIQPAYWDPGSEGIEHPITQPGEFVTKLLARFQVLAAGSGAAFVPSLQDFSARGVTYGPEEVRAEIDGAVAAGTPLFLLWDPSVTYTAEALDPQG